MSEQPDYADVVALVAVGPGRYRGEVTDEWLQGRGAFGGLTAGLFVRAIEREYGASADDPRPIRTLTCHLCEPVPPGAIDIELTLVRRGKYVCHVRADMVAGGRSVAFASATLAGVRPGSPLSFEHARGPAVTPAETSPIVLNSGFEPVFTRKFEFRFAGGTPPFSGAATEACFHGWTRYRGPGALDAAMAAGLLDAWPPAVFVMATMPRPAATMALTYHFVRSLPDPAFTRPDHGCLLVSTSTQESVAGYSAQVNELWAPDGRIIARAHQMFAVIR